MSIHPLSPLARSEIRLALAAAGLFLLVAGMALVI